VRELARRSDLVVEHFRPGTMRRLSRSYADLNVDNRGLIYCSVTGFGSGQRAELPDYTLLVQAVGGLMSVTGSTPDAPVETGVALVGTLTGSHAGVGWLGPRQPRRRGWSAG